MVVHSPLCPPDVQHWVVTLEWGCIEANHADVWAPEVTLSSAQIHAQRNWQSRACDYRPLTCGSRAPLPGPEFPQGPHMVLPPAPAVLTTDPQPEPETRPLSGWTSLRADLRPGFPALSRQTPSPLKEAAFPGA